MKIKSYVLGCLLICTTVGILPGAYASPGKTYFGISAGTSDDEFFDETDTGIKFLLGYQASSNVSVEAAYVDLGTFFGVFSESGLALNAVGMLPAGDNLSIFGKIGLFSWEFESGGFSETGTDIAYGFGLDFTVNKQISLVAEYEVFDVFDADVSLLSLGLKFYFK